MFPWLATLEQYLAPLASQPWGSGVIVEVTPWTDDATGKRYLLVGAVIPPMVWETWTPPPYSTAERRSDDV